MSRESCPYAVSIPFRVIVLALLIWFAVFSIIGLYLVWKDKRAARKSKDRVRESVLLKIALIGGALFMYMKMKSIRHKTDRLKFMWGMPLFIGIHAVLIAGLFYHLIRINGTCGCC